MPPVEDLTSEKKPFTYYLTAISLTSMLVFSFAYYSPEKQPGRESSKKKVVGNQIHDSVDISVWDWLEYKLSDEKENNP